jgi:hypothetical protein
MTKHQQSEPNAQPASDGGSSEWPTMNDIRIHEAVKKWSEPADSTPAQPPASEPSGRELTARELSAKWLNRANELDSTAGLHSRVDRQKQSHFEAELWRRAAAELILVGRPAAPAGEREEAETLNEERLRILKIKRATCQGCLAAAMGKPLHTVADSGYPSRSYCGDAWEQGWEYINGSATWQEHAALEASHAALQAKLDAVAEAARKASDRYWNGGLLEPAMRDLRAALAE